MSDDTVDKADKPDAKPQGFYFGSSRDLVPYDALVNTSGLTLPKDVKIKRDDGTEFVAGYLSPSAVSSCMMCPRYFEYKYVKNFPSRSSGAMGEGSAVHEVGEKAGIKKMAGENMSIEEARQIFRDKLIEIHQKEEGVTWDIPIGQVIDLNIPLIDKFVTTVVPELNPIAVEKMGVANLPVMGTGGHISVVVFSDLIDNGPYGKTIIDYKTGKQPKKQSDVDSSIQLAIYAIAENAKRAGFISLIKGTAGRDGGISEKTGKPLKGKAGAPPRIERIEGVFGIDKYQKAVEDVSAIAKQISAGIFPRSARGTWKCTPAFCEYYEDCMAPK